jgi:hypothetical protein
MPQTDLSSAAETGYDARRKRKVDCERQCLATVDDLFGDWCAMRQVQTRREVEAAVKARGVDTYADFLLPFLRPNMTARNYIHQTYGRFPGTVDAMHLTRLMQAHHLDTDYYDRFFRPGPMDRPMRPT